MLSVEPFLQQWLMWCPECHRFHIRQITVFCLPSTSRPGKELRSLKKGNLGFHTNTFRYVLLASVHGDLNASVKHTHTQRRTHTAAFSVQVYTVLSIFLSLSHTHTQWKSWLSFSIVRRVTLNIYTAWQRQCPGIWVLVSRELPLRRDRAPIVAVNMSYVYLCSGVNHSSYCVCFIVNWIKLHSNSYLWLYKHSWYMLLSGVSLTNVGPSLSSPD